MIFEEAQHKILPENYSGSNFIKGLILEIVKKKTNKNFCGFKTYLRQFFLKASLSKQCSIVRSFTIMM